MNCSRCGSENREGSNFCRYCATPLAEQRQDPNSGYIPSVPPPQQESYGNFYPPANLQQPQHPMPRPVVGHLTCPRCGATNILKGGTPQWAIIAAVVGFLLVCIFSLFFLLVKDPNRCLNCGLEFK